MDNHIGISYNKLICYYNKMAKTGLLVSEKEKKISLRCEKRIFSNRRVTIYFIDNSIGGYYYICSKESYIIVCKKDVEPKSVREALRNIQENKKLHEQT